METYLDKPPLEPPPYLLDSLDDKQREAVNHLAKSERGIAWWRVGCGKTRIALAWMFYVVPNPKPLIICSPGAFRQWEDEIELLGLSEIIKPRFISYGILSRKKDRRIDVPFEHTNCLIIDELWLYKNYKSKRCELLSKEISHRYPTIGLSGSMVTARNIEDIYGQAKAIRLEHLISPNITSFRRDYCIEISNQYTGFIERYPKRHAIEEIQTKIAKHVHIYFPKETRDIRDIKVNVGPTVEQLKIRRQLVKEYYYEHQDKYGFKLEVKSAAALLVKLQQISDGFLRNGEGHTIYFKSNKMLRLGELCAELSNAGERMLIWVAFRESANLLHKELPWPSLILSGEHPFDAKVWREGKSNICVATVGSGASLNDFADVRYALFYSTRFSHLQVQQAKGRTLRKSSDAACRYYYYLQTEGFPDKDVYAMIEKSKATEEWVIIATNKIIANTMNKDE